MLKLEISLVFIVGNAMNKIFKVIFNKSLGRMVIVSENAKSAGKTDYKIAGNSNSRSNTVHHNQQ